MVMAPRSSRSSAIFDLDNDGDLDIVTNDFNSEPQILISSLAQRKQIHWIKINLVGTTSNRNGLGATVRVKAGGRMYTKHNDGKSGYLAQSVLPSILAWMPPAKSTALKSNGPLVANKPSVPDCQPIKRSKSLSRNRCRQFCAPR
jgi:enediyne biosynthesis protein E4